MCCAGVESTLLSPDGTISDNLRDEMPKRAEAEVEAKARMVWDTVKLIEGDFSYKFSKISILTSNMAIIWQ